MECYHGDNVKHIPLHTYISPWIPDGRLIADEQLVVRWDGRIFGFEKQMVAGEGDRLSPREIFSTEGTIRDVFSVAGNSLSIHVSFAVSAVSKGFPADDVSTTSQEVVVETGGAEGEGTVVFWMACSLERGSREQGERG